MKRFLKKGNYWKWNLLIVKKNEVGGNLFEKMFGESIGENVIEEFLNISYGDEYWNISVIKSKFYLVYIVYYC